MALNLLVLTQSSFGVCRPRQKFPHIIKRNSREKNFITCISKTEASQTDSCLEIYQPTSWSHNFIEVLDASIPINLKRKVLELEKKQRTCIVHDENSSLTTLQVLENIDNIERLGLGYRYQNDIRKALDKITSINGTNVGIEDSLHAASLGFRILRQHGYDVSQDFVSRFKDSHGDFMGCLQTDIKGLLSLYEASYLAFESESDLHQAKLFATTHLIKLKDKEKQTLDNISHALELPLYRRMLRLQARWYIEAYGKRKDANPLMLELASLDFNMVQLEHIKELQEVSGWWENIGLANNLSFVRDRLMECFFWAVGMVFEPQYHACRVGLTKIGTLITVIDDIYDVYGSLDELKIFTEAVKRWDLNAITHMPLYLQIGFRALYNTITEIGSSTSIVQVDITSVLVKVWGELLEAFLVEAKWAHDKYIPAVDEYLDNGWRSVSGVLLLTHGYFLINYDKQTDVVESLEKYHDLMKWSSVVFRLCNDLGTSSDEIERGKTANVLSCYMHENGVCEEIARKKIESLIDEAWRNLTKAQVVLSKDSADHPLVNMAINLARVSHCTYQYGDGHGAPDAKAKDRVSAVIIEPITTRQTEPQYTLT
uniref:(E)-beta-ocimene synthase, chloroplastic-like n=1 Tax=Erigeron canadensis TaxID=72917 RepID=UPI001CB94E2A|nr:(E)-beta-ocimene synthase, chloroplastic-like [Erigeron canadensis]